MGDIKEKLWESDEASELTNRAARHIESLESKLAECEKESEWIPCSERLPKEGEHVLFFIKESGATCGCYTGDEYGWVSGEFCYLDATHWKQIEPPQE